MGGLRPSPDSTQIKTISRAAQTSRIEEIMKTSLSASVRWPLACCKVFFLWILFLLVPFTMLTAHGSGTNADLYLVKTDSEGSFLWSRALGGTGWDFVNAVQETGDGGYVLAGTTSSFGAGGQDILLVRVDAQGAVLWSSTFGGPGNERAEGVLLDLEGNIIVFGATDSHGAGSGDLYLVKTNEIGEEIWSRTYGGGDDEMAGGLERTRDGGFILVGTTRSFESGKRDVYVVRTNSHGDRIWDRRHGSEAHDVAYGIKETADGGYVIVGATQGSDSGTWDVYLIRIDEQGDALWHRTWGDGGYEVGYSVIEAADLGFFVSGYTDPLGPNKWDVLLLRTDAHGQVLWSATHGGPGNDRADALHQTEDGGLIIAGSTDGSGSGNWDMSLLGTDAEGNELWRETYGGGDTDSAECVIRTRDGGLLLAGGTYSFGSERVSLEPFNRASAPTPGDRPLPPVLSAAGKGIAVTLAWTASPLVEGYSLLYSPADGSYLGSLDVGNRTMLSVDLWRGAAFYVAVQAHDPSGGTTISNVLYLRIE